MEKGRKRRARRGVAGARHTQSTNAGTGPELRPELAMFAWLLDPARLEAMRRRFIDGKGGSMECWIWKFAYSRPPSADHRISGLRFMSLEQLLNGEGDKSDAKYLNLPPGLVAPSGRPKAETRVSWGSLKVKLHESAWAVVQDPEYQEALRRRIDDGKAPEMERLLHEIVEQNSRKPEAWRSTKPLAFLSKHPPWFMDPLAEVEKAMIEKQREQEEQEARLQQVARDKQVGGTPDTPDDEEDPDGPELYIRDP